MNFNRIFSLTIFSLMFILTACSDKDKETELVDLFATANQDLIAISFPADSTEDTVSINTFVDYTLEGLQSNGVDTVAVVDDITWSVNSGATSTIDRSGKLTTGSVAENITISAKVGILTTSTNVFVSAAKFDQVIQLNDTPVLINMCQEQQINPVGSYINDDGSEEIRPVDNSIINTITWIIRNQEDDATSQRALIQTTNSQAELQALETGNVIIQARATSVSSGTVKTSADFNQTIDNNMNSFKLCLASDTSLATCLLSSTDIIIDNTTAITAVANYQAADGTNFDQNISKLSKWGIDNSNAAIAFSSNRQQIDVTANNADTSSVISAACGNIEQVILDSDIENGVVLNSPITCASGNINCLPATANINILAQASVSSLTVTANGLALADSVELFLTSQPITITLAVTANFSDNSSQVVTAESETSYENNSFFVVVAIAGSPGEYTVIGDGIAEIKITYQGLVFTALIVIPV